MRRAYVRVYVCLKLLNMYVCMYLSSLQSVLVSESHEFLRKSFQNLTFKLFLFVELWGDGRNFWSLARVLACMYACLSSRHVCMFGASSTSISISRWACMEVCLKPSCVFVCILEASAENVCMYDWDLLQTICMYMDISETEAVMVVIRLTVR